MNGFISMISTPPPFVLSSGPSKDSEAFFSCLPDVLAQSSLNKLYTLSRHTGGCRYPDFFEIPGFRVALAAPACPE